MAKYEVILQSQAEKYYRRVPAKIAKSLKNCFEQLEQNPQFHISRIRKLHGYTDLYRYEVGNLRVVYEIHENRAEVSITAILPRGDVYKRLAD